MGMLRRRLCWATLLLVLLVARAGLAGPTRHVPSEDYPTIQSAIDAAEDGDVVLVADGTYYEHDLDFQGKAITVASENGPDNCIVDCEGLGRGFLFHRGEGADSVLRGFTITRGDPTLVGWDDRDADEAADEDDAEGDWWEGWDEDWWDDAGWWDGADPDWADDWWGDWWGDWDGDWWDEGDGDGDWWEDGADDGADEGHEADAGAGWGGGIFCDGASPTLIANVVIGNTAHFGAGIACRDAAPILVGNTLCGNAAYVFGGGIACSSSSPLISGNTIAGNAVDSAARRGNEADDPADDDWWQDGDEPNDRWEPMGGGGIYCQDSSPTISGNAITHNAADYGGGIACDGFSSPTLSGNTITRNTAAYCGGGVACINSSPTLRGNVVAGNAAGEGHADEETREGCGGGIYCESASATLANNTLSGNTAAGSGGALFAAAGSSVTLTNSVLWGDSAPHGPEIALHDDSSVAVTYSDVQGGASAVRAAEGSSAQWGVGNLDADPLFAGPGHRDYHVKSAGGRYDPSRGRPPSDPAAWVTDSVHSPCIDAGDPIFDCSAEPGSNGGRINVGAFGNTPEASRAAPARAGSGH